MSEELFRNKLMISSPTSISLGHITWFALDTKLVGRVKALLEERDNLQSKIDKATELIEFDKKDRMWDLGEGNIMILQEKRVNELLDILKEDK